MLPSITQPLNCVVLSSLKVYKRLSNEQYKRFSEWQQSVLFFFLLCCFLRVSFNCGSKSNPERTPEDFNNDNMALQQDASEAELAVMNAFHREAHGCRDTAGQILEQEISPYYQQYNPSVHVAPYTTIIGPSGIGKTFLIQELARKGVYVAYASLASTESGVYPSRSKMADLVARRDDKENAAVFFNCYIAASLVNIQMCRDIGITATGLFDAMIRVEFADVQSKLAEQVEKLYKHVSDFKPADDATERSQTFEHRVKKFANQGTLAVPLALYEENITSVFVNFLERLNRHEHRGKYVQPSKATKHFDPENTPPAIICIDNARGLFNPYNYSGEGGSFLAFQTALRDQRVINPLFGLLVDSSSKIASFHCPSPDAKGTFPPIYEIDSMDLFAVRKDRGWEAIRTLTQSAHANAGLEHLYNLGRPLWGAVLREKSRESSLNEAQMQVLDLARTKICGHPSLRGRKPMSDTQALALLSYRMEFDITPDQRLSNEFVANHLRHIVHITGRDWFMRTYHPTEPVLALASQVEMSTRSKTRVEVLRALYKHVTEGSIILRSTGDPIATLILMFAMDAAQPEGSHRPVKLAIFLSSLFSENVLESIRERSEASDGLRSLWQEGVVFFNQFVRLGVDPDEGTLWRAFHRAAAVLPHVGYNGPNIIIPIFLPNKNKMSYILVRVSNWREEEIDEAFKDDAKNSLKYDAISIDSEKKNDDKEDYGDEYNKDAKDEDEEEDEEGSEDSGDYNPVMLPHISIMMSPRGHEDNATAEVIYPEPVMGDSGTSATYEFNDLERIVVGVVGIDVSVYPGLFHPKDTDSNPVNSIETLFLLRRFLCCLDVNSSRAGGYEHCLMAPFI